MELIMIWLLLFTGEERQDLDGFIKEDMDSGRNKENPDGGQHVEHGHNEFAGHNNLLE